MRHRRRARLVSTLAGGALACGASAAGVALSDQEPAQALPDTPRHQATPHPRLGDDTRHGRTGRTGRYTLLQMNLCLSGMASCYDPRHPRVVEEAVGVISARAPDAVTINEGCRADINRIAAETGYHVRFAAVLHDGRRVRCISPGRRGVFGNAVMTEAGIDSSADHAFAAQAGREERRWICVQTVQQVSVCTTHLSTRGSRASRAANESQCDEIAAVLAARNTQGPVIAAGDINRQDRCAPVGMWARTDAQAAQLPGRQHGYGSRQAFQPTRARVIPARHTDHDFLLIKTRLTRDVADDRP